MGWESGGENSGYADKYQPLTNADLRRLKYCQRKSVFVSGDNPEPFFSDATLFLMRNYDREEIINVGTGEDLTIEDLCGVIRQVVNYPCEILWDTSMPDGTPRNVLDVSRLSALAWEPKIPLIAGVEQTYNWYRRHYNQAAA